MGAELGSGRGLIQTLLSELPDLTLTWPTRGSRSIFSRGLQNGLRRNVTAVEPHKERNGSTGTGRATRRKARGRAWTSIRHRRLPELPRGLIDWWPKVKVGGLFAGNDATRATSRPRASRSASKTVDEFAMCATSRVYVTAGNDLHGAVRTGGKRVGMIPWGVIGVFSLRVFQLLHSRFWRLDPC